MASYLEASNAAARVVLCSYFSVTDQLARVVRAVDSRFAAPMPFVYDWFRRLCNQEPPEQPSLDPIDPGFTGGQCVTPYDIYVKFTQRAWDGACITTEEKPSSAFNKMGPIHGIRKEVTSGRAALIVSHGAGLEFEIYGYTDTGPPGSCPADFPSYRIDNVVRRDGLPDNCGDPEPLPPPPPPPPDSSTVTVPITYTDNSSNDVTVDVQFTLGNLQIDIDGSISVPFTLSFAPEFNVSLNGTINQNGDVNINYGNPNYNPGGGKCKKPKPDDSVTDDDTPELPDGIEEPTIPPPEDENEDEQKGVIRAVIVTTTEMSDAQSVVYQDVNPDICIPRLGNVSFLIAVGNKVAWTEDIPVRNRRHFIVCPWEGGAIDVRGTPAVGNNFTLSKVYAREQYPVQLLT